MLHTFRPAWKFLGNLKPTADNIPDETMVFSSTPRFAWENGGPITRDILVYLDDLGVIDDEKNLIIDTRVHMLMPGMYPAIPGWHCDGVLRNSYDDQPDLQQLDNTKKNWVVTIASRPGGVSNTRFLSQDVTIDADPKRVWASVSESVEQQKPEVIAMPDGKLAEFEQQCLHTASPCTQRGWRFFFRMSEHYARPINKVRRQVQVYTTESGGW